MTERQANLDKSSIRWTPEREPTPMARDSTIVSNVNTGPRAAIPLAIFSRTSGRLHELSANCAKRVALDKSANNRKSGIAMLSSREKLEVGEKLSAGNE